MKKIKDLILSACGITVLILTLFYLFVSVDTGVVFQMTFSSFAIIFGMSCLISVAKLIFELDSFPYYVRLVLHFAALLTVILAMLGFTGYLASKKATDYFVIIAAYAFIYAVVTLISFGLRKLFDRLSQNNGKGLKKTSRVVAKKSEKDEKKSDYKPLYK